MVNANAFNGTLFESEFVVEALRRGFVTHLPITTMPYDFVVNCPAGLLKVQVKGTITEADVGKSYKVMATASRGSVKRTYGEEVDVLSCWIDELRIWYHMPPAAQTAKCIRLYAKNKRSSSKYEKYRDNWSIFYDNQ